MFGRATDDPQSFAKTVLGVMTSYMFGRPTFSSKMLPIPKLNLSFLYEEIRLPIDAINPLSGIVEAVICDGNRDNQTFFTLSDTEPQQPRLTKGGIHLLYDFVHLLKNIKNNWLMEKMGELMIYEREMNKINS